MDGVTCGIVAHVGYNQRWTTTRRTLSHVRLLKKNKIMVKDRISELPDDILSDILSSLPIKDAVKASFLSSRWRFLWTSIAVINLDADNVLGGGYFSSKNYENLDLQSKKRILRVRRLKFVKLVDQFLKSHKACKIKRFRLQFTLRNKYSTHIDQWIDFAIKGGVEELELDFSEKDGIAYHKRCYNFPSQLLDSRGSSLKCLHLGRCHLGPHFNPVNFDSLGVLVLKDVDITEKQVQNVLSKCSFLERLSLIQCPHLINLKIAHPNLRLKFLNVYNCFNMKELQLNAINLIKFEYHGVLLSLSFKEVPRLVNVLVKIMRGNICEDIVHMLTRLPHDLPQLETLFFYSFMPRKVPVMPESCPTFINLKQLLIFAWHFNNKDEFVWITSLLKASPFLQKFHIDFSCFPSSGEPREIRRPECFHSHLKTVEMTGFCGFCSEMELATYLLRNAIALEVMTIDSREKYYSDDGKWMFTDADESWVTTGRQRASQQLRSELSPSGAQLIIF